MEARDACSACVANQSPATVAEPPRQLRERERAGGKQARPCRAATWLFSSSRLCSTRLRCTALTGAGRVRVKNTVMVGATARGFLRHLVEPGCDFDNVRSTCSQLCSRCCGHIKMATTPTVMQTPFRCDATLCTMPARTSSAARSACSAMCCIAAVFRRFALSIECTSHSTGKASNLRLLLPPLPSRTRLPRCRNYRVPNPLAANHAALVDAVTESCQLQALHRVHMASQRRTSMCSLGPNHVKTNLTFARACPLGPSTQCAHWSQHRKANAFTENATI